MRSGYLVLILGALLTFGCDPNTPVESGDTRQVDLPLLVDRTEVWQSSVDPADPPEFRDAVYWVEPALLDQTYLVDGLFVVDSTHPMADLNRGDVFLSSWHHGYWKRVTQRVDHRTSGVALHTVDATIGDILRSGKLVASSGEVGETYASGLSSCRAMGCSASVDLSFDAAGLLNRAEPGGGVSVAARDAGFKFRPILRFEMGVDRDGEEYTRMLASGSYKFSAEFDITATRPSSMRASYPLPGPGSDMAAISWRSFRDPAALAPEDPRVPVSDFRAMLDQMTGMSTSIVAGPRLAISALEGSMVLEYEAYNGSNPIEPTGGIRLDTFVGQFNTNYAGTGLRALLIEGSGGYSTTMLIVREDGTNLAVFSLLGYQYKASPQLDVAFSVSAPQEGQARTRFQIDGEVEAGWICYGDDDCSYTGQGVLPDSQSQMESEISEGEPFIDFRFQLRPSMVVERAVSKFAEMAPGVLKARADFQTTPPACANRDMLVIEHDVSRLGRRFYTDDTSLFDDLGISSEVPGCTGTGEPPADCSICEVGNDPECVIDVCGEGSACYFGKCSVPADYDITLTWDYSDPRVDLDLWVELPDGKIINSQRLSSGPAELVNMSDGGVSTANAEAGGFCEGEGDILCDGQKAVDGTCPATCLALTKESGGSCLASIMPCGGLSQRWKWCPNKCQTFCDPEFDTDCESFCSEDESGTERGSQRIGCFKCIGGFRFDTEGCTAKTTESACTGAQGCEWRSEPGDTFCVGGRVRCETLDRASCGMTENCNWVDPPPVEQVEFPPYVERVIFNRAIDRPLEFWVVNNSGIEFDENIPFEIVARMRTGVDYELQGFVGPDQGDRSIQYRYKLGEE